MNQGGLSNYDCQTAVPQPSEVNSWGIILAGGDGTRLRSLTQVISGDERPKQFCPLFGGTTLLEQTNKRVALSIEPAKTLVVVTKTHEPYYSPLLEGVAEQRIVVQPKNAGTAPAILYSLMRVSRTNPSAAVAIFPSDHYVSDDAAFMSYVETAFELVGMREDLVVLLGIKPETPETEYGWIEPVSYHLAGNPDALSWVRRFWEKPNRDLAIDLMNRGCYWNSFVMVGKVSAFLKMIKRTVPDLVRRFHAREEILSNQNRDGLLERIYGGLSNLNFSHHVLAVRPGNLAVLPVTNVRWNDLGKPDRVLSTIGRLMPPLTFEQVSNSLALSATAEARA
ncbi:MAG TPA: sugar phosphate nucleotidyltransferase [Pyrinomonadaceae bacterium]|jgi:mannose-1-phosphate guanylyltransferase